jgi:hypothetical protein
LIQSRKKREWLNQPDSWRHLRLLRSISWWPVGSGDLPRLCPVAGRPKDLRDIAALTEVERNP